MHCPVAAWLHPSHIILAKGTGFHCAPLRSPFTSVTFSPPAANNLARLAPHSGFVRLVTANCSLRTSLRKAALRLPRIVRPLPHPSGNIAPAASYGAGIVLHSSALYCQPLRGGSQPPPFVPLSGGFHGSLRCQASAPVTPRGSHASFSRRRYYLFANAQWFMLRSLGKS